MLGEKLKELREKKGFNKKQMAKELNLQYMTYCRYEGNEREPNNETLISIADYFNVTVDYLIGNGIRLDVYPREYEQAKIKCPVCNYPNIHFVRTLGVEFDNEKSSGCAIEFFCEMGHNFYLVFETFKGTTYCVNFGENAVDVNIPEEYIYDSGIYSLDETLELEENNKKYKKLDSYGKKAVDTILDIEYERCNQISKKNEYKK